MQFGSAPVSGRFRIDLEVDRDTRYDHPYCLSAVPWVFAFSMQAEQLLIQKVLAASTHRTA